MSPHETIPMKPPRQKLILVIVIAAIIAVLVAFALPVLSMASPTIGVIFQIAWHMRHVLFAIFIVLTLIALLLTHSFYKRPASPPHDTNTEQQESVLLDQQPDHIEKRIRTFAFYFAILLGIFTVLSPFFLIGLLFYRFTLGGLFDFIFQGVYYFFTGWLYCVPRFLDAVVAHPSICVIGLPVVIVLPFVFHQLIICVFLKSGKTWQFRQLVAVTGIFFTLVIMAVSMTVVMHEGQSMVSNKDALTERWSKEKRIDAHGHPIDDKPQQNLPRR